jgi:hypothetical protein
MTPLQVKAIEESFAKVTPTSEAYGQSVAAELWNR